MHWHPLANHLPIVGRVAAGSPILCEQHIEDHLDIDGTLYRPKADYLLRVAGMSMRDAGILNKDLLAVHRTKEVHNGQVVVARINDEVTVKRLETTRSKYRVNLIAENADFSPIEVDLRSSQFAIEGISVGVIRRRI